MECGGFQKTQAVAIEFLSKFGCHSNSCPYHSLASARASNVHSSGSVADAVTEFFSVGSCKHVFCRSCAEEIKDKRQCKVCGTGTFPKDVQPHRQVNELVSLVQKLTDLLHEDTDGELIENSQSLTLMELPKPKKMIENVGEASPMNNNAAGTKSVFKTPSSTKRKLVSPELLRSAERPEVKNPASGNIGFHWFDPPKLGSAKKRGSPLRASTARSARENVPQAAVSPKKSKSIGEFSGNSAARSTELRSSAVRVETTSKMRRTMSTSISHKRERSCSLNSSSRRLRRDSLKRNQKGETPLHLAAKQGDLEKIKEILALDDGDLNPNVRDNFGWTPLHEASNKGFVNIVELLLDHGALIDVPAGEECTTPLHDAVSNGHEETVKFLIEKGADRNARNILGQNAADLAENDAMAKIIRCTKGKKLDIESLLFNCCLGFDTTVSMAKFSCSFVDKKDPDLLSFGQKYIVCLEKELPEDATHLIVGQNAQCRSFKFLASILRGLWIVDFSFVKQALASNELPNEAQFEVKHLSEHQAAGLNGDSLLNGGGPKRGRINRILMRPGLFYGCHFFLCSKEFSQPLPSKRQIIELIEMGGGKILKRVPTEESLKTEFITVPFHADEKSELLRCSVFLLYVPGEEVHEKTTKNAKEKTAKVSATWLLDCISEFKLLSPY